LVYVNLFIIQGLVKNVKDENVKDSEVWYSISYACCNCLLRVVGRCIMMCLPQSTVELDPGKLL